MAAHLYEGVQDGLGGTPVEGAGRGDVEAVLDNVKVPVGQVLDRKALQRLQSARCVSHRPQS